MNPISYNESDYIIKQFWGIERCQARLARSQRHHITLAIREAALK